MNSKYLPIGTVVTIRSAAKKVMITGYYSIEYQNAVKIYDYVGSVYPEGVLIKNNTFSFNHDDIINVDFMGYQDESFTVLNNILNTQQMGATQELHPEKPFVNLRFDENGVVIYEELSNNKVEPQIIKQPTAEGLKNPFEIPTLETASVAPAPVFTEQFKFDENGVIIEDNSAAADIADIESNFKYEFDENGFIISETPVNSEDTVQYQFDENGVVIGEAPTGEAPKAPVSADANYQFDVNGVVIGE